MNNGYILEKVEIDQTNFNIKIRSIDSAENKTIGLDYDEMGELMHRIFIQAVDTEIAFKGYEELGKFLQEHCEVSMYAGKHHGTIGISIIKKLVNLLKNNCDLNTLNPALAGLNTWEL